MVYVTVEVLVDSVNTRDAEHLVASSVARDVRVLNVELIASRAAMLPPYPPKEAVSHE